MQWRAHLDGAGGDEDLYSDDPGAPRSLVTTTPGSR